MYSYSRVTVVSNVFQNKTDTVDKYYGTPYSISKIPPETIRVIIIIFVSYLFFSMIIIIFIKIIIENLYLLVLYLSV